MKYCLNHLLTIIIISLLTCKGGSRFQTDKNNVFIKIFCFEIARFLVSKRGKIKNAFIVILIKTMDKIVQHQMTPF